MLRINFFPNYFAKKAVITFFLLLAAITILLKDLIALQWLFFSVLSVFLFFYYTSYLTKKWAKYSEVIFKKKLFKIALVIRIVTVTILYFYFQYVNGDSFEFHAGDALGYHNEAIWAVELFKAGEIDVYFDYLKNRFSDSGYSLYLSFVYLLFFKSLFLVRILKALIGAYTCVLIYKVAVRNFGKEAGRISGIITMLLPNLIYYCAIHVKETEMTFLIVAFVERADFLIRSKKNKFKDILSVSLLNVLLFAFRTLLGVSAFISLYGALLFTSKKVGKRSRRVLTGFWIVAIVFIFLSEKITNEIAEYWEQRNSNLSAQMHHFSTRKGANELAEYGSAALFAPIILFAPFPTLTNIEGQENQMMLAGAYYTRNIYAFFVLVGLFLMYKRKEIRKHILLISFVFVYLGVLANTGFALSERFHLPAVPFLLIFAAYGITQMNKKNKKYFVPYLIFISLVIIGWNWFKLAGRGMI